MLGSFFGDLLGLARNGAGDLVREAAMGRVAELEALEPPTERPYGRRLLHRTPLGEVMLATWPFGGHALPHDHGDANGFVVVLRGLFVERAYGFGQRELFMVARRALSAGDLMAVVPDG